MLVSRIDDTSRAIGSCSVLKIRNFLRDDRPFTLESLECKLHVTPEQGRTIIKWMVDQGNIESHRISSGLQGWQTTLTGKRFSLATARKAIRRATADRLLNQLVSRIKHVRRSRQFVKKVTKAFVFGSYLSSEPFLNDLDIAIQLDWKNQNPAVIAEAVRRHYVKAELAGRQFKIDVERRVWPDAQVKLFLKGRSPSISLHDWEIDRQIIANGPHRAIYRERLNA